MTPVTNTFVKKEEYGRQKKDLFMENEDIDKRTENIFTKNSIWVFYLHSGSWKKLYFYSESEQILEHL